MKKVILESPYAGKSKNPIVQFFQRLSNIRFARACVRDSLGRGEAPIASHLLYTQKGILRDWIPEERSWGIEAGLSWRSVSDGTVVYIDRGISSGMEYGIKAALETNKPVEYRQLKPTNK